MKLIRVLVFLLIVNSFLLLGYLNYEDSSSSYLREYANITWVIDGDTIETELGVIRMLGINTPEKKEKGFEEAKLFLDKYVGNQVILESSGDNRDKYGRLLRYAFVGGLFLNKEVLERGLGHYYAYSSDRYSKELLNSESNARVLFLGIWKKSQNLCSSCVILKKLNEVDPGEFAVLKNTCNFDCDLDNWKIQDDASFRKVLGFSLNSGEEIKINFTGRIWNDAGDSFYLRDSSGDLVLFYRY